MMSMSGIISIRALFLARGDGISMCSVSCRFGFGNEQFQMRGRVLNFHSRFFEPGVEVVERDERRDSNAQAERRGDERLGHTAGDGGGCVQFAADQSEGVNHSGHSAEQAEQWRERNDGVEHGQAAIESL